MRISPPIALLLAAAVAGSIVGTIVGIRQQDGRWTENYQDGHAAFGRTGSWRIMRAAESGEVFVEDRMSHYLVPMSAPFPDDAEAAFTASPPLWLSLLQPSVERNEHTTALDLIEEIEDESQRGAALAYIASRLASESPPSYYSAEMIPRTFAGAAGKEETKEEQQAAEEKRKEKRQEELVAFIARKTIELERAAALAHTVTDPKHRMAVLLSISEAQKSLGHSDAADKALADAVAAFTEYQQRESGWWNKLRWASTTILTYASISTGAVILLGLFWKVAAYYFVEALANKVGNEQFAKALGTTLRTAEKSKILIPE